MKPNVHEAKTPVSKVAAVEVGGRVAIRRNGVPVIERVPNRSIGRFPFDAWGGLAERRGLARLAEPTDDDLADAMGP